VLISVLLWCPAGAAQHRPAAVYSLGSARLRNTGCSRTNTDTCNKRSAGTARNLVTCIPQKWFTILTEVVIKSHCFCCFVTLMGQVTHFTFKQLCISHKAYFLHLMNAMKLSIFPSFDECNEIDVILFFRLHRRTYNRVSNSSTSSLMGR